MGKRSVRQNTKHEINTAFDKLLSDHEHGRLHSPCEYTKQRPAYAYTSQCFDDEYQVTPVKRLKAEVSRDKRKSINIGAKDC